MRHFGFIVPFAPRDVRPECSEEMAEAPTITARPRTGWIRSFVAELRFSGAFQHCLPGWLGVIITLDVSRCLCSGYLHYSPPFTPSRRHLLPKQACQWQESKSLLGPLKNSAVTRFRCKLDPFLSFPQPLKNQPKEDRKFHMICECFHLKVFWMVLPFVRELTRSLHETGYLKMTKSLFSLWF